MERADRNTLKEPKKFPLGATFLELYHKARTHLALDN